MFLGYNTNGLAHHELFDAVQLVADLGYRGIALTIDHGVLSPRAAATADQLEQLRRTLRAAGLRSVIETGARFLLDPRRKHEPTLVSPRIEDRRRRIEFYRHAIRCAQRLESRCVSIWSGAVREEAADADLFARLIEGLEEVLNDAARQGVAIALEPEPGMFIDSQRRFAELVERFPSESLLLTLDVGHLHCQGETPIGEQVRRWKVAGEVDQQVLAATPHLRDPSAHRELRIGELRRGERPRARDAGTPEQGVELGSDGLDLGELGHGGSVLERTGVVPSRRPPGRRSLARRRPPMAEGRWVA